MDKKFDTIKMVRKIREKLSRKTKNMSPQELMQFYKDAAQRAQSNKRHFAKN